MRLIIRILTYSVLMLSFAKFAAISKTLPIPAVEQRLANWCWLAAGEMVFRYYKIPDINPAGVYQCGIAAAVFGGPCLYNCAICNIGSGTVQRIRDMLVYYPRFVQQAAGLPAPNIKADLIEGELSQEDLKNEIDFGRPVVAGISPHSGLLPPDLSEHAILLIGYENHGDTLLVILDDPFPYSAVGIPDPYTHKGAAIRSAQGAIRLLTIFW